MPIETRVPFLDLNALHREMGTELDAAWMSVRTANAFVGGVEVEHFEEAFARFCGVDQCVGVGSGTDALTLSLRALGLGPGDEIIVPANTFIATVESIVAVGATPVFVDVDPDTLLVSAEHIEAAGTSRTAAAVVVHLYGQMPNMDEIVATTRRMGIALVEDAAQAHGARWNGKRAGSFGHAAAFSFYPGKNLGAFGDAGAVTTSSAAVSRCVRTFANHGRVAGEWHRHDYAGCNSRLDALQAAILSTKLTRLELWNARRRRAAHQYRERLAGSQCRLVAQHPRATSVHHLEVVRVPERDRVLETLDARGIGWGLHYPVPVHRQPPFAQYAAESLPVVERAAGEIVSLPMFPTIGRHEIENVCDALFAATEGRDSEHEHAR